MLLRELDGVVRPSVVLLQTPSTKMQLYIQDKLKAKFRCNQDTIIDVNVRGDYKKVRDIMWITPPFSDKWFIPVDIAKHNNKDFMDIVKNATSCCFFFTCSKYSVFKQVKESLKGMQGVFDYYITFLRRADFVYLYDAFVHEDNKLTKPLIDTVIQGYSSDVDAIFDLLMRLNQGEQFKSQKDITNAIGLGGLTIESFIFALLKPLSGSADGLKKVMKNRIRFGYELSLSLEYPRLYNFMVKSIVTLIELKLCMISGVVYKTVRNLPDTFDEKALCRYQRYIWRLKAIPMSDLLFLRQSMGDKMWRDAADFFNFIYRYYSQKGSQVLCR